MLATGVAVSLFRINTMCRTTVPGVLFLSVVVLLTAGQGHAAAADDTPLDFATHVAPIFEQHCVRCHSPENSKGDISLATFDDLQANEHVIAGDPDNSYLIELVTAADGEEPAMPRGGDPLPEEQVELLRRWIAVGASWPDDVVIRNTSRADTDWWSLQPLQTSFDSVQSATSEGVAPDNGRIVQIDDFVLEKLGEQGLSMNPPADRATLIRRATYDLIGLPPTPEQVETFVSDPDPAAYEKLINRLLESPHYGERWGRHWLDVVRFGESNGYERNVIINNLWPFRDFVIRSFNEDKPFDQFIREHLAGDVFGHDDPAVAVGSAFLVAGPYDDVGNGDAVQAAQIRANTLDEIIRSTGEGFLGLTLGCARCHDHKFDPISQQDYYRLYATFSGVRHGSVELTTAEARDMRSATLAPLADRKAMLESQAADLRTAILARANERLPEYQSAWTRPAVDRTGTEDAFEPVTTKFIRLVCESGDSAPGSTRGFRIDEFEVWTAGQTANGSRSSRNVALAANGGKATGPSRRIEDFPNAYGPQLAIDGKSGARFIAADSYLAIELAQPEVIDRVVFSSAKDEQTPEQRLFAFVAEYRIEISDDGTTWQEIANGDDRQPAPGDGHLERRLLELESTEEEQAEQLRLNEGLEEVNAKISAVPALPSVFIGTRRAEDAAGPFHVFVGGSPQKRGDPVVPASLDVLAGASEHLAYQLSGDAFESDRREAFAGWVVHVDNPLTPRVLANRLWHYHFGTGIVDTPSDFGYMGGRPTHPQLLDFLAGKLKANAWRLKELHRLIMMSDTYRQSSEYREEAAKIDGDSRLLWRFPPRRLSAEEIRDSILSVAGNLSRLDEGHTAQVAAADDPLVPDGGPGFRLYRFMQDNVCTYAPLDEHGPDTYRRSVYHQNARASVIDLMTDFDQPDCAFSAPRRAETTTPLQALTMLNHSFTLQMAKALAERLRKDCGDNRDAQIERAWQLCCSRVPGVEEFQSCGDLLDEHGLTALCRVLLNTSEMIYVR